MPKFRTRARASKAEVCSEGKNEGETGFTTVSLLVKFATFEFATYIFVLLAIGKV